MADARYTVQQPIAHDGQYYAVGAVVKLGRDIAAPLLADGVVVPVAEKAKAKP